MDHAPQTATNYRNPQLVSPLSPLECGGWPPLFFLPSNQTFPPATPLFATLTSRPQITENKATLSPVFATLTRFVMAKSFACHSYTKSPGVCVTHRIADCRRPSAILAMPAHVGSEPSATSKPSNVFSQNLPTCCSSHRLCTFSAVFCTFLHRAKCQLFSLQPLPRSRCKNTRGGIPFSSSWDWRFPNFQTFQPANLQTLHHTPCPCHP
jgi:hypothetical protein